MENLTLTSSCSPKFLLQPSPCPKLTPRISIRRPFFALPQLHHKTRIHASSRTSTTPIRLPHVSATKGMEAFASISSSSGSQTSSVGVKPGISVLPPSSQTQNFGSPLFWIGVGVGFSALFSWVAANLKKYAMQQAFKTLMGQMSPENSRFSNTAFSPGSPFPASNSPNTPRSPFPFPAPDTSTTATKPSPPLVTLDVNPTKVEATPPTEDEPNTEVKKETKKYAFVDVSPEETFLKDPSESSKESSETSSSKHVHTPEVQQNGAATKQDNSTYNELSQSQRKPGSPISVEALEKMMEDPTVQKMVYPYLPEEMRDPTTFKWMLQNPTYRLQLEDMLNNMGGSNEWDTKMMDSLKNFDISSPEVKEQFDQIGLTPEEVIAKIMANPDVATAFQNPRVQAAIMDCSQNPYNIGKYQNDKEVMDVFSKISELFPGVTGSP